jgi:hypothetical protein
MVGDSILDTLMPLFITAFPTIGALLLLYSESQRKLRLRKEKIAAGYCILLGFLFFIGWEIYWLYAAVAGGFVVVVSIYVLIRKKLRGVPINS